MASGKNSISVMLATAVSLGAIIGAGIFVLSGTAIALAGFGALIAFILVGLVALAISFQTGELSSIMPKEKGVTFSFAYKAFGREVGTVSGLMVFFSNATSVSVIALGFGSYMADLLGWHSAASPIAMAAALIAAVSVVNISGITKAAKADFALVATKICILVVFVVAAVWIASSTGITAALSNVTISVGGIGGIFAASVVIFFAYSGFQTISSFTDRVKGGSVSAAKAIIYSVLISMVLYALVTFSLMLLLPPSAYHISGDPLNFALASVHAPRWLLILVTVGALIATASATLAMMLKGSRQAYQMAKDRVLPKIASNYDRKRDVAVNAVIITAVIAVLMLFAGNIYVIAAITNAALLISYLMTSFSLVHFRRKGVKGKFRSPLYPYLPAASIIAIAVFFAGLPTEALILGIAFAVAILLAYLHSRKTVRNKR